MRHLALLAFCLVCLYALAAPDYGGLGNRIEPRWLGLPFTLTWNLLWIGLSFVVLGAYHLVCGHEREDDR